MQSYKLCGHLIPFNISKVLTFLCHGETFQCITFHHTLQDNLHLAPEQFCLRSFKVPKITRFSTTPALLLEYIALARIWHFTSSSFNFLGNSSYLDVVRIDQNAWRTFTTTNTCCLISRKDAGFFLLLAKGR